MNSETLNNETHTVMTTLESLNNHEGDHEKMTLYFSKESSDTPESFNSIFIVKTVTKRNLGHSDQFEIKILRKLADVVQALSR